MKLFRSLMSLAVEDYTEEKETIYDPPNPRIQSATELVQRTLKSTKSPNTSQYASYSSINLNVNKKRCKVQSEESQKRNTVINLTLPIMIHLDSSINGTFNLNDDNISDIDDSLDRLDILCPGSDSYNMSDIEEEIDIDALDILLPGSGCFNISDINKEADIDELHMFPGLTSLNISDVDEELDEFDGFDVFSLNDYKFMYQIGRGAFGVVHKDFHLKSCQIVAIKECRSNNIEQIDSFKKEIAICNEFEDNQYIINMIDHGMDKKTNKVYVALEYMNMGNLTRLETSNQIKYIQYVSISVLKALEALHSKCYVHNDIKPENILFDDDGNVKLIDFGCIEQMKNADVPLTKQCGTQYYQSYEKRFISPIRYNTKSDIYSFGITICELLEENKDQNDLIPFEIPKKIIEKYSNTNNDLIDFLNKCLMKDSNERWMASQLLKHPFLVNSNSTDYDLDIDKIEDIDDLEFMTNALIDYYSHYKDKQIQINTPIDNIWTDSERIQNIAKYSGYSVQFVQDFISENVKNVKNKYLKL